MTKSRTTNRRRRLANGLIRVGLLLQLVFLLLVDWGSIAGIAGEPSIPWPHVAGLVAVNLVCGTAAVFAWRWMVRAQTSLRTR